MDRTPPRIRLVRLFPRVLSPGIRGRHDRLTALFETNEPARAMMLVDGRRRVLSKFRGTKGRLRWFGVIDGGEVRPGRYAIRLRAFDQAGNRSASTRARTVSVRYVEFRRERVQAVAGKRFSTRVSTYAKAYRWLFNGRRGSSRKKVLVLRAPAEPGRYALYVRVGRHADRADVVVRPIRPR